MSRVSAQTMRGFFGDCARAMRLCAENDAQQDIVDGFVRQLQAGQAKSFDANPIAALRNLQWIKDMHLAKRFQAFARELPWSYSPRMDVRGEATGIMYLDDIIEMGGWMAGLMYADSHQAYPEHRHEAEELYFLISGTTEWKYGGRADYTEIPAGNMLHNKPWDLHGFKTGAAPSLSLFLQPPV